MRDLDPVTLIAIFAFAVIMGTLGAGILANTIIEAREAIAKGRHRQ